MGTRSNIQFPERVYMYIAHGPKCKFTHWVGGHIIKAKNDGFLISEERIWR